MHQTEDSYQEPDFPENPIGDTEEDELDSDPAKFEEDARKLEASLRGLDFHVKKRVLQQLRETENEQLDPRETVKKGFYFAPAATGLLETLRKVTKMSGGEVLTLALQQYCRSMVTDYRHPVLELMAFDENLSSRSEEFLAAISEQDDMLERLITVHTERLFTDSGFEEKLNPRDPGADSSPEDFLGPDRKPQTGD